MTVSLRAETKDTQSVFRSYEVEMSSPATGEWIILDAFDGPQLYAIALMITTGLGSVEYTTRSASAILAGDTIQAVAWDLGAISASDVGYFPVAPTAVRFINTSGTIFGTITA